MQRNDGFEKLTKVVEKLKSIGLATGVGSDRQDIWIEWTELGKSKFTDFFKFAKKRNDIFSQEDIDLLVDGAFYYGIKKMSSFEHLFDSLKDLYKWNLNESLIVKKEDGSICDFSREMIGRLIQFIYTENAKAEIQIFTFDDLNDWKMRIPRNVYHSSSEFV